MSNDSNRWMHILRTVLYRGVTVTGVYMNSLAPHSLNGVRREVRLDAQGGIVLYTIRGDQLCASNVSTGTDGYLSVNTANDFQVQDICTEEQTQNWAKALRFAVGYGTYVQGRWRKLGMLSDGLRTIKAATDGKTFHAFHGTAHVCSNLRAVAPGVLYNSSVGELLVQPSGLCCTPEKEPKEMPSHEGVYYILKNGCSIEGACREQRKQGTKYTYEEALETAKELLERYPKLHVTLVLAHSTMENEIVPKVTPC